MKNIGQGSLFNEPRESKDWHRVHAESTPNTFVGREPVPDEDPRSKVVYRSGLRANER
jgi:hypothetical protein